MPCKTDAFRFKACRHTNRGFTLVELMVVLAIIGILVSIALPNYNDYILKGTLSEASSQLSTLQLKMEQFYQDNRTYARSGAACAGGSDCSVCPPTDAKSFTFSCSTSNGGQNFLYTATGKAGATGFVYTISDAGAKTTQLPSGSSVNCWATSKAGTC